MIFFEVVIGSKEEANNLKMKFSTTLRRRIVEFLLYLPNIQDNQSQQAFLHSAGLDGKFSV